METDVILTNDELAQLKRWLSGARPSYALNGGIDKIGYGSPRGGPSSVAVAASWMLGRLAAKGLVQKRFERQANHGRWFLTDAGHAFLRPRHHGGLTT
jgi:hypothetical protein